MVPSPPSPFRSPLLPQTAYNFHDEEGTIFSKFKLQGGDDATAAVWTDYIPGMELYASHTHFMELAYKKHASG